MRKTTTPKKVDNTASISPGGGVQVQNRKRLIPPELDDRSIQPATRIIRQNPEPNIPQLVNRIPPTPIQQPMVPVPVTMPLPVHSPVQPSSSKSDEHRTGTESVEFFVEPFKSDQCDKDPQGEYKNVVEMRFERRTSYHFKA